MLVLHSEPVSDLQINDRWVIDVEVFDDDYEYVSDDVTLVVTSTSPTNTVTTPTVTRLSSGIYRAAFTVLAAGRYTARIEASGYGASSAVAFVSDITTANGMPTVSDVRDYAEGGLGSYTDPEVQAALNAEASAQRQRLNIGAVYPADLAEALKRRTVRALAQRNQVLPSDFGSFDGNGTAYVPFNDPEIRRLEAPYRKVVMF